MSASTLPLTISEKLTLAGEVINTLNERHNIGWSLDTADYLLSIPGRRTAIQFIDANELLTYLFGAAAALGSFILAPVNQ